MKKWVTALFARKKQAPEPPATMPAMAAPKPAVAAKRNPAAPPEFVEAILKFGFSDFVLPEEQRKPHLLQSVTMTRNNYLNQYFSHDHDILESAYAESARYQPPPCHEWSQLKPQVAAFLSAQDPATSAAFGTFLKYCKKYSKSVEDTMPGANGCRNITVAQHAFSNAEAAELKDALEKMWKVLPDTDPRIVEGFDYAMASCPAVAGAFSGYAWIRNEHRTDYNVAGKVKSRWTHADLTPAETADIATQSAENIALLKPHAREIAEKTLGWCLSRLLILDNDWRVMDEGRAKASVILDSLGKGAAVAAVAKDIENGVYGPPKTDSSVEEDTRKRSTQGMAAVSDAVALAEDIRSGAWFDSERARLLEMVRELQMTPEEKAQRERERHDAAVDKIVQGATVLDFKVRVNNPLRLKQKPLP